MLPLSSKVCTKFTVIFLICSISSIFLLVVSRIAGEHGFAPFSHYQEISGFFFLLSLLFIQWHQFDFFDRCTFKRVKMVDQNQSFQLCLFHWSILDWFNDHSRFHFYPCDNGLFIRVHPVIENKKSETSSNRLLGDTDVVFNRALSQNQLRSTNFWSQLGMDWLCDSTEFVWINWTHSLSKHQ